VDFFGFGGIRPVESRQARQLARPIKSAQSTVDTLRRSCGIGGGMRWAAASQGVLVECRRGGLSPVTEEAW